MQLEHKTVEINAGEFVVIPKTNHRPVAVGEVKVLLFEPNTTVNTGNTENNLQLETSIKSNKASYQHHIIICFPVLTYLRQQTQVEHKVMQFCFFLKEMLRA
jgi:hypothetical protein